MRSGPLTHMVAGFYSLFSTSIAGTRLLTGWSAAHIDAYLAISFSAGLLGVCAGTIIYYRQH